MVLITGLMGLLGLLDGSVKASASTHQREAGTNLARQVLEDARGIPYAQLSPSTIVSQLQAMPGLKNEGSGWQVQRGGITYTIAVQECSIDDGKGGAWGVHVNAFGENPFCKDAEEKEFEGKAGEVRDLQPEDLKRITAVVTWTARGRTPEVRQVQTVSSAGATPGLNAINLHLESPFVSTSPVIETEPVSGSLTFAVSSPTGTTAMRWSLEGIAQSTAPTLKEGTTWTFSWPIPNPAVSDGTYTVAVQSIDKLGVLGPPVSIPVTLIRNVPVAVSGIKGGFNKVNVAGVSTKVVDLQWQPNAERNIIGYRVYRPGGILGSETGLACPGSLSTLSTTTSCIDFASPEYTASNLTYKVVALYRNVKGEVAEGSPGLRTILGGPPPPPNPPPEKPEPGLQLTHNAEGAAVLTWNAPSGGEPVIFYRIYRGSTNYTSRYNEATGTEFIDTNAAEPHTYWVTAVDANLTESTFSVSVTG
ncbi:MAG TPA: hypothetical protein VNY35_06550 [Solirubrobacteraceae bacterium]|nr:hypothetical protein [Solirubrobacteraceae bacterium]